MAENETDVAPELAPVPGGGVVLPNPADADPAPEDETSRPPLRQLSGIKFRSGQVDVKKFTASDLHAMGVGELKSDEDLVWNRLNNYTVPIDAVNAATLDAIIKLPGFTAV
jgi:hypothetical protein